MSVILRAPQSMRRACGEVAEWSNAPDSKSGIRVSRIEGSNPSLSANLARVTCRWPDGPDPARQQARLEMRLLSLIAALSVAVDPGLLIGQA